MERSKKWTREDLKSESKGWIENIPENYQDDVLDLLKKYSSIMVGIISIFIRILKTRCCLGFLLY